VLVAEDDPRIAHSLAVALKMAGFVVETAADGEDVWFRGDTEEFDAVILDLGLPKLDGLTTLKRWRKAGRNHPVLILTARGNDERLGDRAGADDYVAAVPARSRGGSRRRPPLRHASPARVRRIVPGHADVLVTLTGFRQPHAARISAAFPDASRGEVISQMR
jgi:CheY-like chemotaxis protein